MKYNMVPLTDDELEIITRWAEEIERWKLLTLSNEEIKLLKKLNNKDFSL